MAELKPCPFCGCKYEKDDDDFVYAGGHQNWCPLSTTGGFNGNYTVVDHPRYIEAWNKRTERPKGRWETDFADDNDGNRVYQHYHRDCGYEFRNYLEDGGNFCPNCGADMR